MRSLAIIVIAAPLLVLGACGKPPAHPAAAERQTPEAKARHARALALARARSAIEGALSADAKTGSIIDYATRADAMRAVDLSACPPTFRAAYLDHIAAWDRAAALQGLPRSKRPADRLRQRRLEREAMAEVHRTFERVEHTADAYGAQLPVED